MEQYVRRDDLRLRSVYPSFKTRIFEVETGRFLIYVQNPIKDSDALCKEFDYSIRFITSPVDLTFELPPKYVREIPVIEDSQIGDSFAGIGWSVNQVYNLLYSKNGEPVILTEAGRDGKAFGLLNLTFNKDGIITKAQNNMAETSNFYRNMVNQYIFDDILGKPEKIGYIKSAPLPPATLIEENPHANFMCDALKHELNADIAVWNNAGPRNFFHEGVIDPRDVRDIAPFRDGVSIANVSEKTMVQWFKDAIDTTYKTPGYKPGLVAVSGLNYTVNPQKGTLVAMNYIDKNGVQHNIDINNPRENKLYKIATDSFMMSGGVDHGVLAKKEDCINYKECKDYFTCQYIKHLDKPIVINNSGRINFV
mgnify:CR=1 FL=1